MAELSKEDHAKLVELLADFAELATENQRRDVLIDAGLRDLLPRLDLSGAPGLAVNRLVDDLDAASLKLLIAWAAKQSGVEQQKVLGDIVQRIDAPRPVTTPPGTPEQPESPDKKGTVVKLELDLGGTITNFNQEAFQRELSRLLGAQVKGVKITSIQPGSVKITLEGDPEALRALVEKLKARDAQTKQFIRATDLVKAQFTAGDGKQYAIKLDGMSLLAIGAIVVAAVVVGGIVVWKLWPSGGGPATPDASTLDAQVLDAQVRDAQVRDAHVPDAHPRDAGTRPRDARDESLIDAASGEIAVVISSDPGQVDVTLDGIKLGTTPINTTIHRGTNTHAKLRGTKTGFTPVDAEVDATRNIKHLFVLQPARGTATIKKQSRLTALFQLEGDEATAIEMAKSLMVRKCRLQRKITELDRSAGGKIAFRCGDAFDAKDLVGLWHETNLQGRLGDVTFQAGGKLIQTLHSVDPVSCPGDYTLKLVDANHATVTYGSLQCEVPKHPVPIAWVDFEDHWRAGTLVKQ